jgi:nicotinamide-nucleotide amidase
VNVEVLNTGTELLLGNVINTHAAYFGREVFPLGMRISRQVTVPDGGAIRSAMIDAFGRCEVLLVTGGLGPTTDDITRDVVAEVLGRRMREDAAVLEAIESRLARRGIAFRPRMRVQTLVPEGAEVMPNAFGTAPGLYLPATSTACLTTPHVFLFPGPPRELQPMFEGFALPRLRGIAADSSRRSCRIYHVVGMGETAVEEMIGLSLTARGDIEVGYCARPNQVDFRLIADEAVLEEVDPTVRGALGDFLVSNDGRPVEAIVVGELAARGMTLATAESCTGGLIADRITNVPGASFVFREGWVTYANDAKVRRLGVPEEVIANHGAVSEPVARAMAEGALAGADASIAISVTGIAGPGGGTLEKPVGTVFTGLAQQGQATDVRHHVFATDRETFKSLVAQTALDWVRRRLRG